MPPDLSAQIPYIRRIIEAMRIPILEYSGFEADDVIGTITRRAEEAGVEVVIVSSDKDMLQLVTSRASMLNRMKDDLGYDEATVPEFLGVTAVPIEFTLDGIVAREPDVVTLKKLYQELEFHSLVREMGPSEDTRVRDYQRLETPEAIESYLQSIPEQAPLAIAIDSSDHEL